MKSSILSYFPAHLTPRPQQAKALLELETAWSHSAVIVLCLPTGVGKTEVMVTIARWLRAARLTSNLLLPTNAQVDQFGSRYPELQTLHARKSYRCTAAPKRSCATVKTETGEVCKGCVHQIAKRATKAAPISLMNCHTYWSNAEREQDFYADVDIYDEAHNLADMLRDTLDTWHLLRSEYGFPEEMTKLSEIIEWLQDFKKEYDSTLITDIWNGIIRPRDARVAEWTNRKDLVLGKDDNGDDICDKELKFIATSGRHAVDKLALGGPVRKLVLLSATINDKDIYEIGLDSERVTYITSDNPIPPERRPIYFKPAVNLSRAYMALALPKLVSEINLLLASKPGKGLIHAPYPLAVSLMQMLDNDRLIFHSKRDKRQKIKEFKDSPPSAGKVLVASGLYEGVDLPYKQAEWQLITKVPFLSLGDAVVAEKAEEIQDWYDWEAIKRIIQATGRIVRAADDYGETWILDNNFEKILRRDRAREKPMFPADMYEALKIMKGPSHE